MFTKPCPVVVPHGSHEHIHHWVKSEEEPEGWFPPGSHKDQPENGWDARYKCRGVGGPAVEDARDIVDGRPRYISCQKCDHEEHICGGCGEYLTHSGHELKDGEYVIHGTSCVD